MSKEQKNLKESLEEKTNEYKHIGADVSTGPQGYPRRSQ
jgi:hypothetical protein